MKKKNLFRHSFFDIVLYNLREKKIAATTRNSDGWPRKR